MIWRIAITLSLTAVCYAQMDKQRACANQVKADIEKSQAESPAIYATIKTFMFEYSKSYDACVIIMQYRVNEKGQPPKVQVLALNAVTMQPMAGYREAYLIPASDEARVMEAASSLFEKYSH